MLRKASPNFGISVDEDFLLAQQRQAMQSASKQTRYGVVAMVLSDIKSSFTAGIVLLNLLAYLDLGRGRVMARRVAAPASSPCCSFASLRSVVIKVVSCSCM